MDNNNKTITNERVRDMQRVYDMIKEDRERIISNVLKFALLFDVDTVDVYRRTVATDGEFRIESKLSKHNTTDHEYNYVSQHTIFGKRINCYCNEPL